MKGVFGDTFFFLALLVESDDAHEKADQILDELKEDLYTTTWVLTEVGDALSAPGNRELFINLLEFVRSQSKVVIIPTSDDLFMRGVDLFRRRMDKEWSLTDCISFVVMEDHRISRALTGDHHFEQAGFVAMMR